ALELGHQLLGARELLADNSQVRSLRGQRRPSDFDRRQHRVVHEEDETRWGAGAHLRLGVVVSGIYGIHGSPFIRSGSVRRVGIGATSAGRATGPSSIPSP